MLLLDIVSLGQLLGFICLLRCITAACQDDDSETIQSITSNEAYSPKSIYVPYSYKLIPREDDDNDNCCSICLCDYEDGEMIEFLDCLHFFHAGCFAQWLALSHTCPICRFDC
ncbi:hypothetical protein RND81_05G097100 [Saponaria officinalis]|uniref:RING-type E3 ubiquitin transferase n=1 Tax=Saponaria officinalis TaxID=3572 RepID=A0AAW1KW99_SAPOF